MIHDIFSKLIENQKQYHLPTHNFIPAIISTSQNIKNYYLCLK